MSQEKLSFLQPLLLKAREEYSVNGYARIPGVFSKQEADQIRSEAFLSLMKPNANDYLQLRNGFPALLFWPRSLNSQMARYRNSRRLAEIVKFFLGDDVLQLNNQVYFRLPGDGDQFAWHQDVTFRTPAEDFQGIEEAYLQTIIVVDEITLENAPVLFVPGSHKLGHLDLIPRDNTEKGLRAYDPGPWEGKADPLLGQPGDVLIWSVMSVHGSRPNLSNRSRMTYMNGFAKASAVRNNQKHGFPWYLKKGAICAE